MPLQQRSRIGVWAESSSALCHRAYLGRGSCHLVFNLNFELFDSSSQDLAITSYQFWHNILAYSEYALIKDFKAMMHSFIKATGCRLDQT